jgi:hypothetical protein
MVVFQPGLKLFAITCCQAETQPGLKFQQSEMSAQTGLKLQPGRTEILVM